DVSCTPATHVLSPARDLYLLLSLFFFFTVPATTEIYTLSLHDALPILIVTNAAGGLRRTFRPGDLMIIDDHINFTGRNPLAGPVVPGETRFPDMTEPYDRELQAIAERVAAELGVRVVRGVYCAVSGPSYETPAEIRMLQTIGADAVGMSTVPEVIVARALGIRVLGISLISNLAAGITPDPLSHEEVIAAGREAGPRLASVGRGVLRRAAGLPDVEAA